MGATARKDGYIEGGGYAVTWAFGHLVGPAMPEATASKGSRGRTFRFFPKPSSSNRAASKAARSTSPIREPSNSSPSSRSCSPAPSESSWLPTAGREGELIFRFIYHYLYCKTPFDRLWISSLTERAIREGLANIRPGSEYDDLYLSARARCEADWIVGINASQALAIAAGRGAWSLGRVQTPTLALVCGRYLENTSFTPQTYFRLKLHTAKDATAFAVLSTRNTIRKRRRTRPVPQSGAATACRLRRSSVEK